MERWAPFWCLTALLRLSVALALRTLPRSFSWEDWADLDEASKSILKNALKVSKATMKAIEKRNKQQPDPAFLVAQSETIVFQVNGKLRDRADVAPGLTDDELVAIAMSLTKVQAALAGAEPVRRIVVPGKLVNLVVPAQ